MLFVLAAFFGAAHALTPGHGKTLVAAYLVGERGTIGHAFVLGLVTTLTHTGAVLALAFLLPLFFPRAVPADVQTVLGLVGGLLVAGMGFWLLLRRLSGGADHFHIGGHHHHHGDHHHHHHHGHADHFHDGHGHAHPLPDNTKGVGWWGLVVLGISGGIVPCWDAIVMLGFAIFTQRLWLGVPLLLAFSAGLASVLILIGIGVVYFKGLVSSRWAESRLIKALPLVSAALVTVMGLWLCYESMQTAPPDRATITRSQ
jgi:ABC-type nickel/cobalt efflux system permease component RcnA